MPSTACKGVRRRGAAYGDVPARSRLSVVPINGELLPSRARKGMLYPGAG